jgi:hypothetical protein
MNLTQIGGFGAVVTANFTRPANTTAYTAGDVVNNSVTVPAALTLSNCARVASGSGFISKVKFEMNSAVITNALFRIYFFTVAPTAINDNAPFTLLHADVLKYVGSVDITMRTEGSGSDCAQGYDFASRIPFVCAGGDANLYAIVVAEAAYTPTSGEVFNLEIYVEQN